MTYRAIFALLLLTNCPQQRAAPLPVAGANYTEEGPLTDWWYEGFPLWSEPDLSMEYGEPFLEPRLELDVARARGPDAPLPRQGEWLPPPVSGPPLRYPSFMLPPAGAGGAP